MATEAYIIFKDKDWYSSHKEEVRTKLISLSTYISHKGDEYWLLNPEGNYGWGYNVRVFLDEKSTILVEISSLPPIIEKTLTELLNWIRAQTPILFQDEDGDDFGYI